MGCADAALAVFAAAGGWNGHGGDEVMSFRVMEVGLDAGMLVDEFEEPIYGDGEI